MHTAERRISDRGGAPLADGRTEKAHQIERDRESTSGRLIRAASAAAATDRRITTDRSVKQYSAAHPSIVPSSTLQTVKPTVDRRIQNIRSTQATIKRSTGGPETGTGLALAHETARKRPDATRKRMDHFTSLVFFLSLALTSELSLGQTLYSGDRCELRDSTPGICTIASQCPWFLQLVAKGRHSERVSCGFEGAEEVICCKTNSTAGVRSRLACERVPKYTERITFHIIDGEEAGEGEFPFMAALGYESDDGNISYRCGASLISSNFLLTAAHCIPMSDRPKVAILGTNNLAPGNPGVVIDLKAFYPHPEYKSSRSYHDIALVELVRHIEHEPDVNPICLNDNLDDLPESTVLSAEGYGIIDLDRNLRSNQLMKVNLTTVPWTKCNQSYADANLLKNNRKLERGIVATQYCSAGRENDLTKVVGDTCQGDSGGPLQILDDGKYKLIGVTSFGNGCGSTTPNVSTRVASYIAWIESVVWGS